MRYPVSPGVPLFNLALLLAIAIPAASSARHAPAGDERSVTATAGVESDAAPKATAPAAARGGELTRFNPLIGSWRGVGQPQRGSRRGAWTETVAGNWNFADEQPAIVLTSTDGKQFESLRLSVHPDQPVLQLKQILGDETRIFTGPLPESWPGQIQLITEADDDGSVYRCSIEQLSDIRLVVLLEQRSTPTGSFRRVAGIGYTREGRKLAEAGGGQRKCVVTGGLGTIAVMHEGKTWYVCCEGCRQVFEASPGEIIDEYRRSLAAAADRRPDAAP